MCRKFVLSSTVLCVLLSLVFSVEASPTMWRKTYGTYGEAERAYSLIETSDGGYAIGGGGMAAGSSYNFLLIKTDESGHEQWSRTYIGGVGAEWIKSMVQTSDGGYALAGGGAFIDTGFDFWLVKTDENGNMEWNQTYGGTEWDEANSLVETSDGGYVLAGQTESCGNGDSDFWIIKTDAYGTLVWNKTYGGPNYDSANSLVETSDGGYCVVGFTWSFGNGNSDCWFMRIDSEGNMEWNQTYGGENGDWGNSLIQTSDGGYAIAGYTNSSGSIYYDFWLIKTDVLGNMEWNQTYAELEPYGKPRSEYANSLVQTSDGGYVLAGTAESENWISSDIFDALIIKTDETGKLEWNHSYGGSGDQDAQSLIATSDEGYALAGYTMSHVEGNMDILLIKTNEYGIIPEFPSWTILLLFMVVSLIAILIRKRTSMTK